MAGLADLVPLANQYTGIMVAMLWISGGIGWRMLNSRLEDNGDQIDSLAAGQQNLHKKVQRVDLKQDHIQERQEVVMDRVGVNENQIQELHMKHASENSSGGEAD